MRLGLGSYAYAWAIGVPGHPPERPMTPMQLLEEAARLGVGVVQLCDNLPLVGLSPARLERFAERANALNLQVELGTLGLHAGNLRAHLQLARRFGSPLVRLVVDAPGDEPPPEKIVTRLRPLVNEFANVGVQLAIENHDRLSSEALAEVVELLGPEHVGICLDTVNSFGALEGPKTVVATLGRYTRSLHAKDFKIRRVSHRMGFVLEGCPAGQGQLDMPWLLRELAGCPHPFNVILESWVPPGNTLRETIARECAWAESGVHYLRRLIKQ